MDKSNVEEIHPLSYLQKALLMHHLKEKNDEGFIQVKCMLEGNLDHTLFKKSIEKVIDLHKALRTSIHWKNISKPMQVVHKKVAYDWEEKDLSQLSKKDKNGCVEDYLSSDQKKGLQLDVVPVFRFSLFKLANNQFILIWSCHHILIDGWSTSIVLEQILKVYDLLVTNREIDFDKIPSFFDYLKWTRKKDRSEIERFWDKYFLGFDYPTLIGDGQYQNREDSKSISMELNEETSNDLRELAKTNQVSLNILFQSLWAIVLSKLTGRNEIAYGVILSGRSGTDLPNIEKSVGMFMNILPVRVKFSDENSLIELGQLIQKSQIELSQFDYVSLNEISLKNGSPNYYSFFNTLFIFENFLDSASRSGSIRIREINSGITTTFPLTIGIVPTKKVRISLICKDAAISHEIAEQLIHNLKLLIDDISSEKRPKNLSFSENVKYSWNSLKGIAVANGSLRKVKSEENNENVGPLSDLEKTLLELWKNTLELEHIGLEDNFFEIGGTSLKALVLFDKISHMLGIDLPITILLNFPTVKDLAKEVESKNIVDSEQSNCIVPFKKGSTNKSIYCLHSHTGDLLIYKDFIESVKPEYSVYGVQPREKDNSYILVETVEELVERYLKEIKKNQPEGPYSFLSFCYSCVFSIELARKLRESGDVVEDIVMIDPAPFGLTIEDIPLTKKLKIYSKWVYMGDVKHIYKYFRGFLIENILHKYFPKVFPSYHRLENSKNEFQKSLRMMIKHYNLVAPDFKVVYIQTTDLRHMSQSIKWYNTWTRVLNGNMELHAVNGDHMASLKKPYIQEIADLFGKEKV